jgi:GT2 family glycosyltransferase
MKLSILIVNWNSKDHVRECLRSLEKHVTSDHETIVVDGASFDGCGEMIAAEFPAVRFVQSPHNVGFGRCNNLGAEQANGEYLLFLNPDTEVKPSAVEALLEVAESDAGVGLVGACLLNTDGSLQTSCVQALPTPLNRALDSDFLRRRLPKSRLWGTYAAFAASEPVPVEAVSGACMLIHRDHFAAVGGFCPDYFMYAEDMHLCWDVAKLGKRIVYQPAAVIVHHGGGASSGEFSRFSCLEMNRALHQFIAKRQGKWAGLAYRGLIGISASIRLVLLAGAWVFSGRQHRARRSASIRRWWTTLKWAVQKLNGNNLPSGTTVGAWVSS